MSSARRILFITNECVGLGHLRRTINLARAVSSGCAEAASLIVTGSAVASAYTLPPRVDTIKLPVLVRDAHGAHRAGALGVDAEEAHHLRSGVVYGAATSFAPHVAVIDKTPLGLRDELSPALEALHAAGCRLVLGLRDVEDAPERVRESWSDSETRRHIERLYDHILVYGPPSSPSALASLDWPDLTTPVAHVGYVGPQMPEAGPPDLPARYVLVTPGGGVDGMALILAAIEAARTTMLPVPLVIVTGPLMSAGDLAAVTRASADIDAHVEVFRDDMEAVVAGASVVVGMAGYNTVAETLRAGRPALLVPRTRPSREQLVRARSVADAGLARVVLPDELTPQRLSREIDLLLNRPPARSRQHVLDGATRSAEIILDLAATARSDAVRPRLEVAS